MLLALQPPRALKKGLVLRTAILGSYREKGSVNFQLVVIS